MKILHWLKRLHYTFSIFNRSTSFEKVSTLDFSVCLATFSSMRSRTAFSSLDESFFAIHLDFRVASFEFGRLP